MKARLLIGLAGFECNFEVGQTVEGPDAEALVRAGYAEPITETATVPIVAEKANVKAKTERASKPKAGETR